MKMWTVFSAATGRWLRVVSADACEPDDGEIVRDGEYSPSYVIGKGGVPVDSGQAPFAGRLEWDEVARRHHVVETVDERARRITSQIDVELRASDLRMIRRLEELMAEALAADPAGAALLAARETLRQARANPFVLAAAPRLAELIEQREVTP